MDLTHSELDLDLGALTLRCDVAEIEDVFAGLLREMRAAAPFIRADEREALRRIMAYTDQAPTVADVFPDFARDSDELTTLRKLRTAQFIRPGGRDSWERDAPIEIRPFARLAWERLGEAVLFGEEPDATPEPDSDIELVVGDADAAPARAKWNEDDVLDFLNDGAKG